jgi:acetylornithine deacetylase/succinyl-diaminopimelate desuccinylase-like protein
MGVHGYVESNAREFTDALKQWLAIPSISAVAVGLDSDQIHAPNESVDLSLLLRGAEASAYLWDELAAADLR